MRALGVALAMLAACCAPTKRGPVAPGDDVSAWAAGVALDELLLRGVALSDGERAQLDAPRRLLIDEYRWVRAWKAPAQPPGRAHKPGRAPRADLGAYLAERGATAAEIDAATRVALTTVRGGEHDAAFARVLEFHLDATLRRPALDDAAAAAMANGVLTAFDPQAWLIKSDTRLIGLVALALAQPWVDASVDRLTASLRAEPLPAPHAARAAELTRWWADVGAYLYLDTDVFARDGDDHGAWFKLDTWRMYADRPMPADGSERPASPAAWTALATDTQASLARDSLDRRRADRTAWRAWRAERDAALGLPRE